jgi:hypothetical protein
MFRQVGFANDVERFIGTAGVRGLYETGFDESHRMGTETGDERSAFTPSERIGGA